MDFSFCQSLKLFNFDFRFVVHWLLYSKVSYGVLTTSMHQSALKNCRSSSCLNVLQTSILYYGPCVRIYSTLAETIEKNA